MTLKQKVRCALSGTDSGMELECHCVAMDAQTLYRVTAEVKQ